MKQHKEASRMVKRVKKMSKKGLMRGGLGALMPGGGGGGGFGGLR
jgi:signal recognition particle subunit SRP54